MWAIHRVNLTLLLTCWLCGAVAAECRAGWQTDLEAAKREAASSNRLVLVHFWTAYCGPCKRLEKTVLSQPAVIEAVEQEYVLVKLDAEKYPEVARKYGVDRFPTDVAITPKGDVIKKVVSPPTANAYVVEMKHIAMSTKQSASAAQIASRKTSAGPGANEQTPATAAATSSGRDLSAAPEMATSMPAVAPPGASYENDYSADYSSAPPADPRRPTAAAVSPPYGRRPAGGWSQQPGAALASDDAESGAANYAGRPGSQPSEQMAAADPGSLADMYDRPPADAPGSRQPPVTTSSAPSASPAGPIADNRASLPPAGVRPAPPSRSQTTQLPPGSPPLGLDGFCPVHLAEGKKWLRGDTRYGAIHRGRTYLFASESCQKKFMADPDHFSPVLQGNDVVVALEDGKSVPGRREFGVFYGDRVYLFASEATRDRFERDHQRLAEAAAKLVR